MGGRHIHRKDHGLRRVKDYHEGMRDGTAMAKRAGIQVGEAHVTIALAAVREQYQSTPWYTRVLAAIRGDCLI